MDNWIDDIEWDDLLDEIRYEKCILVIGPDLISLEGYQSLFQKLAQELAANTDLQSGRSPAGTIRRAVAPPRVCNANISTGLIKAALMTLKIGITLPTHRPPPGRQADAILGSSKSWQ